MSFYDNCKNQNKLSLICGPCVFEGRDHAFMMSGKLKEITDELGINFIYKTSFDKANRTSASSYRGKEFDETYYALQHIYKSGIEIITDVHEEWQCGAVAANDNVGGFASILQIPAFLCRQTNLLKAATQSRIPVMVKKGQFLSPWEAKNIVEKLNSFGCNQVLLCERGTTFGYNNLVVDMRSLEIMKSFNVPIVMDCTHAIQMPGVMGNKSGGDREMAKVIARAAVGVGISAVFMEVHNDPDNALSDGPNSIKLDDVKPLLETLLKIDSAVKNGHMP